MDESKETFKKDTLYKVLYSEDSSSTFKSPKGHIVGYDSNFIHLLFQDGRTKSISLKHIISVTELGDDE
jgi:hypothetical protein